MTTTIPVWNGPSQLASSLVAIDTLEPWPGNPRHGDIDAIAASLDRFGQVRPILVREGRIVAGHHVVAAAEVLGWTHVAVLEFTGDETEARAYLIADNRTSELGTTDDALLIAQLRELDSLAGTGFTQDDQAELETQLKALARLENPQDPDDVPEPPAKPKSKLGESWLLGPHLLVCGDAFDPDARARVLEQAKGLVTDPPYGINLDTDYSKSHGRGRGRAYRPVLGDDQPFDASELVPALAHIREQFWFGANYYRRSLGGTDYDGSWLVWDKRTEATDVAGSSFEQIWSRQAHKQDMLRHMWTNYTSQWNDGLRREHATEKPVTLVVEIVRRWIPEGRVVDLFAGAGTTLIACERTGHQARLLELDPAWCDVIRTRYAIYADRPDLAP